VVAREDLEGPAVLELDRVDLEDPVVHRPVADPEDLVGREAVLVVDPVDLEVHPVVAELDLVGRVDHRDR
jgi:hypothetical protein